MKLRVYRLVPAAAPDDPRWDVATGHGEVVVRAYNAGDARLVAAQAETDFLDIDAKPAHGASTRFASAFLDEKLYRLVEEAPGTYPEDGPRGLVEGTITETLRPLEDKS